MRGEFTLLRRLYRLAGDEKCDGHNQENAKRRDQNRTQGQTHANVHRHAPVRIERDC